MTPKKQKLGLAFIGTICGIITLIIFLVLGSGLIEATVFGILIFWVTTGLTFRKYIRQK